MTFQMTLRGGPAESFDGPFRFYPAPKPPANLTVQGIPPTAPSKLLVTLTRTGAFTQQTVLFRVYYLSAAEIATSSGVPIPLTAVNLARLSHFVIDLQVPGSSTTFTVPVDRFLAGGWFYATAIGSDGSQDGDTYFAPIPLFFTTGVPTHEITSPNYVPWFAGTSRIGPDGLHYRDITVTWLTAAFNPTTTGAKFIQIYIQNYDANGGVWEGPVFNNPQQPSFVGKGLFTLECDDGTGGFPPPGAHNVTLYFVSVASSGVRRSDPLSSPSKVIVGGIFS